MLARAGSIWLGLALAIAGCAAPLPSIETLSNAPLNTTLGQEDGGVVIGLEPVNLLTLGRQVSRLEFWRLDPDRGLLLDPKKGARVVGLTRTLLDTSRHVDGDMEYLLQRIPAGHYFLTYVDWGDHGHSSIRSRSLAFTVKPGEVTYIGNFGFDTPLLVMSEVELRVLQRRPDAARKFLAQYTNIKSPLWDQQPVLMSLRCDLSEKGTQSCLTG